MINRYFHPCKFRAKFSSILKYKPFLSQVYANFGYVCSHNLNIFQIYCMPPTVESIWVPNVSIFRVDRRQLVAGRQGVRFAFCGHSPRGVRTRCCINYARTPTRWRSVALSVRKIRKFNLRANPCTLNQR